MNHCEESAVLNVLLKNKSYRKFRCLVATKRELDSRVKTKSLEGFDSMIGHLNDRTRNSISFVHFF